MPLVINFRSYVLHYFEPEFLKPYFAFMLGVALTELGLIPSPWKWIVKVLYLVGGTIMFHRVWVHYPVWFAAAQAEANSHQPIGASQPEVDLEAQAQAQALNFPPMLGMADLTFNIWELP